MSEYQHFIREEPEPGELKRALITTGLLAGLLTLFAFGAHPDPTKVVTGMPCSVLSENEVGAVLGAPMRLMPTDGTICHYLSTDGGPSRALFVVARRETSVPSTIANDTTPVYGVGETAAQAGNTLYVRYGSHSYAFTVVPASANDASHIAQELRLAKLMHNPLIARH